MALLVIDPWLARSFGFALSTLATLGLLLFASTWGRWFARFLPPGCTGSAPALAIPVAAQAMCGPVVVLLQGSVEGGRCRWPTCWRRRGGAGHRARRHRGARSAVVGAPVAGRWPGRRCSRPRDRAGWPALRRRAVGSLPWPDGASGRFLLAALSLAAAVPGPWLVAPPAAPPCAWSPGSRAVCSPRPGRPATSRGRRRVAPGRLRRRPGRRAGARHRAGPRGRRRRRPRPGPDRRVPAPAAGRAWSTPWSSRTSTPTTSTVLRGCCRGRVVRQILASPVPRARLQLGGRRGGHARHGGPGAALYAGARLALGARSRRGSCGPPG